MEASPAGFDLLSAADEVAFSLRGGGTLLVGRGSTAQITIAHSSISRHHAKLTPEDGELAVEDLGSTNGTFVNDSPVTKAKAADGDTLKFGDIAYVVRRVSALPQPPDAAGEDELDRSVLREMPVSLTSFGPLLGSPTARAIDQPAGTSTDEKRLDLLLEVSKKFSQHVSLDALLESIVDVTCQIMNVHRVSVLLADASGRLTPLLSRQRGKTDAEAVRPPDSILRRVTTDKVAVRTDDAGADVRFGGPSVLLQQVRGAMCTPLLSSRSEVMGAIYVDNLVPYGSYTDEELDFLVSFGGIAAAALENSRLSESVRAKAVALSNFERYFAPDLAAAIAAEREQIQLGGVKRPAVILFSDVRGFTAISERIAPDALVTLLNEYFTEMVDIVFEHGGALDKFIGDAILANWGAALARDDDADRALKAAIEMQRTLQEMNKGKGPDEPRFEVGIGINRGEVFVGNIGSHRRLEYTVIGDPVNVASRLCSTAARGEIIVSDSFYQSLLEKPEVQKLEREQLRGRAGKIATYRVLW